MCRETSHINQVEKIKSDVIVQEDCMIPPHSYGKIAVMISEISQGNMPLEEGMVDFMGKTDLHPWRNHGIC